LNDPHNCGSCGHDCQGGACQGGVCQPVLLTVFSCNDIALSGGYVYYAANAQLGRVPIGGGAPQMLVSGQMVSLAVDATNVYYAMVGSPSVVGTVPLGGGTTTLLATGNNVQSVAVDATTVFFSPQSGAISSVPKGGGTVTAVANVVSSLALHLRMDGTNLYWVDPNLGEVATVPKAGGAKVTLYSGNVDQGFDLAGGTLYFQSYGAGGVVSLPTAGGTPTFLTPGTDVRGISASSPWIYLADNPVPMTGAVARAPIAGGNRVTVASPSFVWAVAADATSVYWCGQDGVSKLAL
jgi:hypothetical protein